MKNSPIGLAFNRVIRHLAVKGRCLPGLVEENPFRFWFTSIPHRFKTVYGILSRACLIELQLFCGLGLEDEKERSEQFAGERKAKRTDRRESRIVDLDLRANDIR